MSPSNSYHLSDLWKWLSQYLYKLKQRGCQFLFFAIVLEIVFVWNYWTGVKGKKRLWSSLLLLISTHLLLFVAVTQIRPPVWRTLLMNSTGWFPSILLELGDQYVWWRRSQELRHQCFPCLCQFDQGDGGSSADCYCLGLQGRFL